jgi:hypothetical protein
MPIAAIGEGLDRIYRKAIGLSSYLLSMVCLNLLLVDSEQRLSISGY